MAEQVSTSNSEQFPAFKLDTPTKRLFYAGARPALLWVCVLSLFFFFVVQYAVGIGAWAILMYKSGAWMPLPLEPKGLLELTAGILGLSGMRTYEKIKGVHNE